MCENTTVVVGHNQREYELCTDPLGRRVWLNADDGSAVARFNVLSGVDLHTTITEQMAGASECLWCTHGQPDKSTWERFITEVQTRYGVLIPPNAIDKNRLRL